jgi:hypothetical protein
MRPGGVKDARALGRCGARGQHVVDQDDARRRWVDDRPERPGEGTAPLLAAAPRLRVGLAHALE